MPEVHQAGIVEMIRVGRSLDEIRQYYQQKHNIHPELIQIYLLQLAGEAENN